MRIDLITTASVLLIFIKLLTVRTHWIFMTLEYSVIYGWLSVQAILLIFHSQEFSAAEISYAVHTVRSKSFTGNPITCQTLYTVLHLPLLGFISSLVTVDTTDIKSQESMATLAGMGFFLFSLLLSICMLVWVSVFWRTCTTFIRSISPYASEQCRLRHPTDPLFLASRWCLLWGPFLVWLDIGCFGHFNYHSEANRRN